MTYDHKLLLINPNATVSVTERMAVAAREVLGPRWYVEEMTNVGAPPIITDDARAEAGDGPDGGSLRQRA